jgi:hypothetical protein
MALCELGSFNRINEWKKTTSMGDIGTVTCGKREKKAKWSWQHD